MPARSRRHRRTLTGVAEGTQGPPRLRPRVWACWGPPAAQRPPRAARRSLIQLNLQPPRDSAAAPFSASPRKRGSGSRGNQNRTPHGRLPPGSCPRETPGPHLPRAGAPMVRPRRGLRLGKVNERVRNTKQKVKNKRELLTCTFGYISRKLSGVRKASPRRSPGVQFCLYNVIATTRS